MAIPLFALLGFFPALACNFAPSMSSITVKPSLGICRDHGRIRQAIEGVRACMRTPFRRRGARTTKSLRRQSPKFSTQSKSQ